MGFSYTGWVGEEALGWWWGLAWSCFDGCLWCLDMLKKS